MGNEKPAEILSVKMDKVEPKPKPDKVNKGLSEWAKNFTSVTTLACALVPDAPPGSDEISRVFWGICKVMKWDIPEGFDYMPEHQVVQLLNVFELRGGFDAYYAKLNYDADDYTLDDYYDYYNDYEEYDRWDDYHYE